MLGSMNDAMVLWLFSIYQNATLKNIFNDRLSHEGIKLYIIKDKGYPLFLWLVVLHKQTKV
jgi:hypothetical protein